MFSTQKFGGYLSRLRKDRDMTQSDLAEKLNLTRQAISKYETGDSFPDVSILVEIANIFHITLDDLIRAGEPTKGEAAILTNVANGVPSVAQSLEDIRAIAPLLKPSVLDSVSQGLARQGIDITSIVEMAQFLNDQTVIAMLENAQNTDQVDNTLLQKLIPFMDNYARYSILKKILAGEMDWHLLRILLPYADYNWEIIEAAVIEGALPWEALDIFRLIREDMSRIPKREY